MACRVAAALLRSPARANVRNYWAGHVIDNYNGLAEAKGWAVSKKFMYIRYWHWSSESGEEVG